MVMYDFTANVGFPNYGLAIILFTVVLRVLMFPLSLTQAKSSSAMSILQPQVQKLQQQYKNDQNKMNEELQALYKKYGVNPLSGCLPMLVQMPVLFALFSAMRGFEYVGEGASFLWMANLSEPDPTKIVLPVIVGLTSYLQSKLSMSTQPAMNEQAKSMNMMMLYAFPIMIAWSTRSFAAGVAIYWCTFNVMGFLMQIVINSLAKQSQEEMRAKIESDETKAIDDIRKEAELKKLAAERRREADRQRALENKKKPKNTRNRKASGQERRGKPLNFDD